MPDSAEYLTKIRAAAGGGDPVETLRGTANEIARLIEGRDDAELRRKPTPKKWSVAEIIMHLADDEVVTAWRYRQMIENPGVALAGFDQDLWAKIGRYEVVAASTALKYFAAVREANVRLLEGLSEEQWLAHGMHAERGRIDVRGLARHMMGHDANHLQQIRNLLGA